MFHLTRRLEQLDGGKMVASLFLNGCVELESLAAFCNVPENKLKLEAEKANKNSEVNALLVFVRINTKNRLQTCECDIVLHWAVTVNWYFYNMTITITMSIKFSEAETNCRIAHILGILLMVSKYWFDFYFSNIIVVCAV